MHIKFLRHGKGDARAAVSYLLGTNDHKGEKRPCVEVLRGDPRLVAEVANGIQRAWRYSSAVMSFHPDDRPTDAQRNASMDAFEQAALGNQPCENFSFAWIDHGDHLHFICARVRLDDGKAFNPCPPSGGLKRFTKCRDWLNLKHAWASPADPARSRPGKEGVFDREAFYRNLESSRKHARDWLDQRVRKAVMQGEINSRQELLDWLQKRGLSVARAGKHISVVSPKGTRLRLDGAPFYSKFFDAAQAEEYRRAQASTATPAPASAQEVEAAKAAFDAAVASWDAHLSGKPRKKPQAQAQTPEPAVVPSQPAPQIVVSPSPKPQPQERSTAVSTAPPRRQPNLILAELGIPTPQPTVKEKEHEQRTNGRDATGNPASPAVGRDAPDANQKAGIPAPSISELAAAGWRDGLAAGAAKRRGSGDSARRVPDGRDQPGAPDAQKSVAEEAELVHRQLWRESQKPLAKRYGELLSRMIAEWMPVREKLRQDAERRRAAEAFCRENAEWLGISTSRTQPQRRKESLHSPWRAGGPRP